MHDFKISEHLADLIRGLHPEIKMRIKKAFSTLARDPHAGKRLKDEMEELRSFKVKRLRIIYRLGTQEEVQILAIGPKEQIYEDTFRLIMKQNEADS